MLIYNVNVQSSNWLGRKGAILDSEISSLTEVWVQREDPLAIASFQSPPKLPSTMGDQLQYELIAKLHRLIVDGHWEWGRQEYILLWKHIHNWPGLHPLQKETIHSRVLDSRVRSPHLLCVYSLWSKESKLFLDFQLYFMNKSFLGVNWSVQRHGIRQKAAGKHNIWSSCNAVRAVWNFVS